MLSSSIVVCWQLAGVAAAQCRAQGCDDAISRWSRSGEPALRRS